MSEQKYTQKVIEVINSATDIAKSNQNPSVDVPHLLRALFDSESSFYVKVLNRLNIDTKLVSQTIDGFINSISKSNGQDEVYPSTDFKNIIFNGTKYQKEFQDDYLSVEHLLLGQFDSKNSLVKKLMEIPSYDKDSFIKVIKDKTNV